MARKRKSIRVIYKKLGRQKFWGQTGDADEFVEIDPRCKGKKHLEILIHESLHIIMPTLTEEAIENASILLTNTLWNEDYRRIDNNNSQPLQDGTN